MAASTLRHQTDKGILSVFISEDEILYVCSKGHWWVVKADESGEYTKASASPGPDIPADLAPPAISDRRTERLMKKFGSDIF